MQLCGEAGVKGAAWGAVGDPVMVSGDMVAMLRCAPETNVISRVNYTSIKIINLNK